MLLKRKYKLIRVYNHPFFPSKKQVKRSRLVMAESLGRPLLRTELVHHKDENTMDDRIDNLEIMLRGRHTSHHRINSHHTIEARKKMSLAHKGKPNHRLGKHHTMKARKKIGLAQKGNTYNKGRILTAEHRYKISIAMKGNHRTVETKKKISLAGKDRILTVKHRRRISGALKDYFLRQEFPGL